MSNRAMPFVYLNMGGEMMYILEQRLQNFQAQNVGSDKSIRVLCDIVATMLSRQCLEVVFRPQPIYSRVALRHFFEHIAHSSVMRLNEASMDKLFDLMTMATKYQVLLCKEPSELVLITLNHLDGIKRTFEEQPEILQGIAYAQSLFIDNFVETPLWEMAAIRSEILNFFNGHRVKVSLMLREGRQLEDGRFVLFSEAGGKRKNGEEPEIELPYGSVAPGTVRYVAYGETAGIETFPCAERFKATLAHQHRTISRGTTLGQNMYKTNDSTAEAKRQGGASAGGANLSGNEVKFLSQLLAGASPAPENPASTFNLSIFDNDLYASGEAAPPMDENHYGDENHARDERKRRSSTGPRAGGNASTTAAAATTTTRSASLKRMKSLSSAVREMSTSEKSGNEDETSTLSTPNTSVVGTGKCVVKATVSTPFPVGTSGGRRTTTTTTTTRSKSRSRGAEMLQLMDEATTTGKKNPKQEETTSAPKRAPSNGSDKKKRTSATSTVRK